MSYLYKTYLFKVTHNVVPVPPDNTANLADFEDNHKATASQVSEIIVAITTFICDDSYADFVAKISTPITWADVKYIETGHTIELNLVTTDPL